jgi:hypothetical protein
MEASATFWGHSVIHKTGFSRVPSPLGFGHATDRDMRTVDNHILTRSHETKTGDGPSTPQFIFKPYYVWITSLLCGAVGRV